MVKPLSRRFLLRRASGHVKRKVQPKSFNKESIHTDVGKKTNRLIPQLTKKHETPARALL